MTNSINDREKEPDAMERPLFAHPPWMVGVVLVFAVLAIIAGLSDPIWFFVGMPCILVLVLYIYVQIVTRIHKER
jgi:hypothetical protein